MSPHGGRPAAEHPGLLLEAPCALPIAAKAAPNTGSPITKAGASAIAAPQASARKDWVMMTTWGAERLFRQIGRPCPAHVAPCPAHVERRADGFSNLDSDVADGVRAVPAVFSVTVIGAMHLA